MRGVLITADRDFMGTNLVFDWLLRGTAAAASAENRGWRDIPLGFFAEASVSIAWHEADVVPLPRYLRRPVISLVPERRRRRAGQRRGSLLLFNAQNPLP